MMILADLTAGYEHNSEKGYYYQTYKSKSDSRIGHEVALRYDLAKAQFCIFGIDYVLENWFSLGGMEHGHMAGTYYFLSNDYEGKMKSKTSKELAMRLHRILAQNMS